MTNKTLEQRAIEERAWIYPQSLEQRLAYIKGATDQESRHLLTVEQETKMIKFLTEISKYSQTAEFIKRTIKNFLSIITKQETKKETK